MDWIENYQLFLFDFDGLLVDTEPLHYAAYMEMAQRHNCPLDWDFQRFCFEAHSREMGFFDGLEREHPNVYQHGLSRKELYAEKKKIYSDMLSDYPLQLMEGVQPLLEALGKQKAKCAVVTNSPKAHIDLIKKKLPDLHKIPLWITREDYTAPKPSPEGYLKAVHALAQPNDRIIGFEDSLKGLKALIAAGVDAVLVCPPDSELVNEALRLGASHYSSLTALRIAHCNKV
jgi:HAD superfamily hydrolase (TIGR01509 family)